MLKAMYLFLALALFLGAVSFMYQFFDQETQGVVVPEDVMCTMDARQCPDGSYVGRTGLQCEFVCPITSDIDEDIKIAIESHRNMITVASPAPLSIVTSPLTLTGQARGAWFFEASFPVVIKDGAGTIIAKGPATAEGDWMTSEFVPFTITLTFTNPYQASDPDFMKRGMLILRKDNPSGESVNDDSLEIPVRFAP